MTPEEFVAKWQNTTLGERQTYQFHFVDVCQLVGHPPPDASGVDKRGKIFTFEQGVKREGGGQGYADVFYEGHFAVEYKGKDKYADLTDAYRQLQRYRENLNNPPLLVVCDIANWEIHTNWNNAAPKVYRFSHRQIAEPSIRRWLTDLFSDPERLHPERDTAQVTIEAAAAFKAIVDNMRDEWKADPDRIAHFLTKVVFCLFAEDIGLLPALPDGKGIFTQIVDETRRKPDDFRTYIEQLFAAMAVGGKLMLRDIPYFNGTLFENVQVERLGFDALNELDKACHLDWSAVAPAIFGTLFERSLDPSKRSQLGAHYTAPNDILLIVEPVLIQPLRREWAAIQEEAAPVRKAFDAAATGRDQTRQSSALLALREKMLHRLRTIKVLDPACGSGNFLYVSLQLLKDLEKEVIHHPLWAGLPLALPEVHPRQLYGIETNAIAHALTSIVVWIGYIQWHLTNGYLIHRQPILEQMEGNIRRMDAIMTSLSPLTPDPSPTEGRGEKNRTLKGEGEKNQTPVEPEWPEVDVIVSNPPFLGGKRMRSELGDKYIEGLFALYENRVPHEADLVCYWFEKARAQLEKGKVKRVGLLATNSIRGGANRKVLERIKDTGDIFMGWSDREWVLEGAAVRVSMVGFDKGEETSRTLDGVPTASINPDLTASVDITVAKRLPENFGLAFMGDTKGGPFDIPDSLAQKMLEAPNESQCSNREVVYPWVNGSDITGRRRYMWLIDFGVEKSEKEATSYEAPFKYISDHVAPTRLGNRRATYRDRWWIHMEPRPALRAALKPLARYICTPRVAKHRLFVWLDSSTIPDSATIAIARDDDYFFGVLHSRIHEVWSLRMGTWLGVGNDPRYTPTTTFETFPFPWPPGKEDKDSAAYQAISAAAKRLDEERAAWLNPLTPGPSPTEGRGEKDRTLEDKGEKKAPKGMEKRTLTNLYNALNVYRGVEKIKIVAEAGDFAPRLDELHRALDAAVCAAYGWPVETALAEDEDILRRLLALNLARSRGG